MTSATDLYFPSQDRGIKVTEMPNAKLRLLPSIMGHLTDLPRMDIETDEVIEDVLNELLRQYDVLRSTQPIS